MVARCTVTQSASTAALARCATHRKVCALKVKAFPREVQPQPLASIRQYRPAEKSAAGNARYNSCAYGRNGNPRLRPPRAIFLSLLNLFHLRLKSKRHYTLPAQDRTD